MFYSNLNMTLSSIFRKLFISGDWEIAFRRNINNQLYQYCFVRIPNTKQYWFADPLLFESNSKTYLFCEAFERKTLKGELGYFAVNDGKVSDFKLVLNPNYHMSFPNVFELNGRYYMLPESGENLSLELYEAKSFPDEWEKVKNLVEGVNYVDPTLLFLDDEIFVFVYIDKKGEYETRIYKLNTGTLELEYHSSIYYKENVGRSAGQFFKGENGEWKRPVQWGEGEYGKRTAIYNVDYKDGVFVETVDSIIDNNMVVVDGRKGVDKIHTYSKVGSYESIDFVKYKFDFLKRIKILNRKRKLAKRHK